MKISKMRWLDFEMNVWHLLTLLTLAFGALQMGATKTIEQQAPAYFED
ncbi:hypothetical protein [Pontiella desulfatans]|nr:hypothetical protein [Pontiella desulfatans]